jgi:CheY-like chemotaxis protein
MNKSVLIVDDDKWLADTFALILTKHRWNVTVCHDPHKAIDVIDEMVPSVILLDFMLPYASGAALLHELQSYVDTKEIPVVICSSLNLDSDVLSQYGVVEALDKSTMTPETLVDVLEEAIHETSS